MTDLQTVREALEAVEPYADQLADYSSTAAEWPANLIPRKIANALEALSRLEAAAVPELSREDVVRLAEKAGFGMGHAEAAITLFQRFASLVRSVPSTGENNVRLDHDSNDAQPKQQRAMAGALALGQPVGGGSDTSASNPASEGAERVAAPVGEVKPCLVAGNCKHGSWCSDVYCQEHCRFIKEIDALEALAELCDEATGGWDLPPSAVARIGAIARKACRALTNPPAPPEGWKLVPVEPTPEMIAAAAINVLPNPSAADFELSRQAARIVLAHPAAPPSASLEHVAAAMATIIPAHRAMLAAAPQPGDKA